jgi:guanylate kinase
MELLKRRANLKKVVTCTTRPIREGEVDGVSYHFLDRETFQRHINTGAMLEWDEHYDNLYGSRRSDVEALMEAGHDVLFVVDIAGAQTIKKENPDATLFFVEAESTPQLLDRIVRRDKGNTVGLEERKAAIEQELIFAKSADHRVVNREGKLDETVAKIQTLMDA